MSSKRPRTTLLLTEEILDALRALSKASGMSMSSIVVQFLEPSVPVMRDLEVAFNEAKKDSAGNARQLLGSIVSAANEALVMLNESHAEIEEVFEAIESDKKVKKDD